MEKEEIEVKDATMAVQIAKSHLEKQMITCYWNDVKEVSFDEEDGIWTVLCEAKPAVREEYHVYEIKIESSTGYVASAEKLEKE